MQRAPASPFASSCFILLLALSAAGCGKKDLAHRVQARIHAKVPDSTIVIKDASTLEVKVGDEKVTVSLDSVATVCKNDPDHCDEMIDRVAQNVVDMGEPEKPAQPQELRAVLKSKAVVEDNRRAIAAQSPPDKLADNQIVTFPFQGDIMLVLVRDMPNGIAMLNHGALGELHMDEEKARVTGLANTEKALTSLPTESAGPGIFRVRANDSYEAARILVPRLWDALAKQVVGDLLVVAPTRDIVFATGSKDAAAVASMNAMAKKAWVEGPYSLSTTVLRRTDAGFVTYAP